MSDGRNGQPCCDVDGLLRTELGDAELALARAGFSALWRGEALRPDELIPDSKAPAVELAGALARRGRAQIDDHGRLFGIHGLTLRATRHRFVVGGTPRSTWCAYDSVGIPAALDVDAVAETDCPTCGRDIHVIIEGGHPLGEQALWLPAVSGCNLMADFCGHADLYCSVEHLQQRIDPTITPGAVIDLPAAAAYGRETWADVRSVVDP